MLRDLAGIGEGLMRRLPALLALLLLVGCRSAQSPTVTVTATFTAQVKGPPPTPACDLCAVMVKDSGVYGIPMPKDAAPVPDSSGLQASHLAGVVAFTAFYQRYLKDHDWTPEPSYTTADPDVGVTKSLGFTTWL